MESVKLPEPLMLMDNMKVPEALMLMGNMKVPEVPMKTCPDEYGHCQ